MTREEARRIIIACMIDGGQPSKVAEQLLYDLERPLTKTERNRQWRQNRLHGRDKIVSRGEKVPPTKKHIKINDVVRRKSPTPASKKEEVREEVREVVRVVSVSPSAREPSVPESHGITSTPGAIVGKNDYLFDAAKGVIIGSEVWEALNKELGITNSLNRAAAFRRTGGHLSDVTDPNEFIRRARQTIINSKNRVKVPTIVEAPKHSLNSENYGRKPKSQSMIEEEAREERKRQSEERAERLRAERHRLRDQHVNGP